MSQRRYAGRDEHGDHATTEVTDQVDFFPGAIAA
jgi:hypothetical protein